MHRVVAATDIESIALGASIYGSGGGGDPYIGHLIARNMLRRHGDVQLLDIEQLTDEAFVLPVALVGAPAVAIEKFPSTIQFVGALHALERHVGKKVSAILCAEAGGLNSTIPFCVAAQLHLPLLDGDLMGRAFPEIQMTTCTLHGIAATPMALCDDKGNVTVMQTATNRYTERFVRALATEMGGAACTALYPMTGAEVRRAAVRGSVSLLQRAGQAVLAARKAKRDPVAAVLAISSGRELLRGKIVDVQRRTEGGFNRGSALVAGLDASHGRSGRLSFQNEFLMAEVDGMVVATTPDLIVMLDAETGEPITGELMRYGLRVAVLGIPCDLQWRSQAGVALAGPRYFGYDVDYVPVEGRVVA